MPKLEFENLEFRELEDKAGKGKGERIEVTLLKNFFFYIGKKDMEKIGDHTIGRNFIEFKGIDEKKAAGRFNLLISEGIKSLKNRLNSKPAVYIHRNSGIPLIGSLFFGIVDRGSTIVEVKPLTSCNLNCMFCSVDEGISGRKETDFVVEEEYLVDELRKLLEFKKSTEIEVFINPHGEPLLYADIVKLVKDIKEIKYVKKVAIITNGALLTEKLVDDLEKAGLDQLNLSVNSLDDRNSRIIAGTKEYDITKIKKIMEYITSKERRRKLSLVVAPVWVPGVNDKDIKEIAEYCNKAGCSTGIQKYVRHKKGRNPQNVEEMDWPGFFRELEQLEGETGKGPLIKGPGKTPELPRPFRTGEIVKAKLVCPGRLSNEGIAVFRQRAITVYGCGSRIGEPVNIKLIKSKNNIFFGKCLG